VGATILIVSGVMIAFAEWIRRLGGTSDATLPLGA